METNPEHRERRLAVEEDTRGRWALEGSRLVLSAEGDRPGQVWELADAEPERLVVKK